LIGGTGNDGTVAQLLPLQYRQEAIAMPNIRSDLDDEDPSQAGGLDAEYYLSGEPDGTWCVYSKRTSLPALLGKQQLVGLTADMAQNMLELLNQMGQDSRLNTGTE
jgi:hypothetical protein